MDTPRPQGQAVGPASLPEMHWQAERELAEALSAFQCQVEPAAELTLLAVVEAARPAFRLGFSFSVRSTEEGTTVLLMHRSGAQQSAESEGYDDDFRLSARLLAGLLGIPLGRLPRPSEAEDARSLEGRSVVVADGAEELSDLAPVAGPALAGGEPLDPALEPLSAEEISTLTAMLKELARSDKEGWKRFSLAFRDHFEVPRTARTITDRITQRRHADFIDRFEQELAAVNGVAPAADEEAI